jgi:hypothetical protein
MHIPCFLYTINRKKWQTSILDLGNFAAVFHGAKLSRYDLAIWDLEIKYLAPSPFYLFKRSSITSTTSIKNLTLKTGYSLRIFFKMPPEIIKFILPDFSRARRRQKLSGGNILPGRWKWGAGAVEK